MDGCLQNGGRWQNIPANFDNVLIACITLFEMMTTEGWIGTMNHGIDSVGVEKVPKFKNRENAAIYFIAFMVIGSFLIINLFTAVITDNFNEEKESHELGTGQTVNEMQKQWVDVQNIALTVKPKRKVKPPQWGWRYKLYKLTASPKFDIAVISVIILNTLVIA